MFVKCDKSFIDHLVRIYAGLVYKNTTFYNNISFAWDKFKIGDDPINVAKNIVSNTNILIVVGYSFPFFNRVVDRDLLGNLNMKYLKKVYFQDLMPQNLIDRFKAIREDIPDNRLIPYHDVGQFFLPPEL